MQVFFYFFCTTDILLQVAMVRFFMSQRDYSLMTKKYLFSDEIFYIEL